MIIAVDGMGGDNAPHAVTQGCVDAINEYDDVEILLVGIEDKIKEELSKYKYPSEKIKVINAPDIISNNEPPAMAVRRKKNSSMVVALNLVKKGEAQAVVSAGSTGAFLTGSTLIVGRIKGIQRAALAPIIPGSTSPFMLIDCGANVDCKPLNLLQFALMGKVYFENVLKVTNPTIGLINIGTEEEKGNELTKESYKLLKESPLNFIGNIEPRDIPYGKADIFVCDGFVGNTVLKMYEGVLSSIFSDLKKEIMSSFKTKVGGILLKPVFSNFKKRFDYREYGGTAFLGVNGICIKAHGSSDARAFKNAIKQSIIFEKNNVLDKIKNELESVNMDNIIKHSSIN